MTVWVLIIQPGVEMARRVISIGINMLVPAVAHGPTWIIWMRCLGVDSLNSSAPYLAWITPFRAAQGYQQELRISLEEAYKGATRLLQSDGREKQVRIPAGVRTGSKVRVAGAGPNGLDLYLIVDVQDDKNFERRGNDLHTTATVSVFTAILGGEAEVETMDGKVKLNIPAGTQPEQVFRLAGRGMPHVRNLKEKGDLFVRLKVQIPKYLSPKQTGIIG